MADNPVEINPRYAERPASKNKDPVHSSRSKRTAAPKDMSDDRPFAKTPVEHKRPASTDDNSDDESDDSEDEIENTGQSFSILKWCSNHKMILGCILVVFVIVLVAWFVFFRAPTEENPAGRSKSRNKTDRSSKGATRPHNNEDDQSGSDTEDEQQHETEDDTPSPSELEAMLAKSRAISAANAQKSQSAPAQSSSAQSSSAQSTVPNAAPANTPTQPSVNTQPGSKTNEQIAALMSTTEENDESEDESDSDEEVDEEPNEEPSQKPTNSGPANPNINSELAKALDAVAPSTSSTQTTSRCTAILKSTGEQCKGKPKNGNLCSKHR